MKNRNDIMTAPSEPNQMVTYNAPSLRCFSQSVYFPAGSDHHIAGHWHDDMEYLYVKKGAYQCTVNGERLILEEGTGICINSRRIHSNGVLAGRDCYLYCVVISPEDLCANTYVTDQLIRPFTDSGSFDYLLLTENDWTKEILERFIGLFEKQPSVPLEIAILETELHIFGVLSSHIVLKQKRGPAALSYEQIFKNMAGFIQTHYTERISLADIAEAGGVGETLCAKLFRKYTEKTPGSYLISYRLARSTDKLIKSDMSITEIAYSCGFGSASHYTEIFRKMTGETPKAYRNARRRA